MANSNALLAVVDDSPNALREMAGTLLAKPVAGGQAAKMIGDRYDDRLKISAEVIRTALDTLVSAMKNEKATAAMRMAAGVAILKWIARGSGKLTETEFPAAVSAMRYVARRQLSARRAQRRGP